MSRRRPKKPAREIPLSCGPLPKKFDGRFTACLLVFSDASRLRYGGLACVIYPHPDASPIVITRTVPAIGSNALELQAALMALDHLAQHFPDQAFALFSDNRDAVDCLLRLKTSGMQDAEIAALQAPDARPPPLDRGSFVWVPGHASCRGNALADAHARCAASG